jgi:hypothetical protein
MLNLHSGELALVVIRVLGVTINLAVWAVVLAVLWLQRKYWKGRAAAVGVENDHRVWSRVLRWYATAVLGAAAVTAAYQADLARSIHHPRAMARFGLSMHLFITIGVLFILTRWTIKVYVDLFC